MDFDPAYMDAAVSRGGMPLVSWEPWKFGAGLDQREYALRNILSGQHDAYIRNWARAAAAWGKPFFLRFAHEMNGDWTTWSPGVNGNTPASSSPSGGRRTVCLPKKVLRTSGGYGPR
jgi:hypothetical protein